MAMIEEQHVEWRVVARLKELLERQPEAEHDEWNRKTRRTRKGGGVLYNP